MRIPRARVLQDRWREMRGATIPYKNNALVWSLLPANFGEVREDLLHLPGVHPALCVRNDNNGRLPNHFRSGLLPHFFLPCNVGQEELWQLPLQVW
jgi:hypothetical protein